MVPPAKGIDHRIHNGYIYLSAVEVTDPAEVEARVPFFEKRAAYYYEHWNELYQKWENKFERLLDELTAIELKDLPDIEPESIVFDARGYGSTDGFLRAYDRLIQLAQRAWQYHMEFDNLTYAAYVAYSDGFKALLPDITDKAITETSKAFDGLIFRPAEELQKLAKLAVELNLGRVFAASSSWADAESNLKQMGSGQKWLDEWEKARDPWFEISIGTGWYHTDIAWNDDLNYPFSNLKRYLETLEAGESIDRPREQVIAERDRITAEYRSLIQTEEDRNGFDQLLGMARLVAAYPEDHIFFVENRFHVLFWRKMRRLGEILVNHRCIEEKEDLWYLSRFELYQVLYDVCAAWATGVKPVAEYLVPKKIEKRKRILEIFGNARPDPALGLAPEAVTEPETIALWGITTEVLDSWLEQKEVDHLEVAELKGMPGSTGVTEGPAKVVVAAKDLSALEVGDIMVAPTTSPMWSPAFASIKGCVTDIGGVFCHAAIVAREYHLPAVVGTGTATKTIKTGDRIRVDGGTGVVTIIKRAQHGKAKE
jgi:pyruvate,water dikinase